MWTRMRAISMCVYTTFLRRRSRKKSRAVPLKPSYQQGGYASPEFNDDDSHNNNNNQKLMAHLTRQTDIFSLPLKRAIVCCLSTSLCPPSILHSRSPSPPKLLCSPTHFSMMSSMRTKRLKTSTLLHQQHEHMHNRTSVRGTKTKDPPPPPGQGQNRFDRHGAPPRKHIFCMVL